MVSPIDGLRCRRKTTPYALFRISNPSTRWRSEMRESVLDDIPIKGCLVEEKDESKDEDGCRRFVINHIKDSEKVLQKLEGPEAISIQGERYSRNERRMCVSDRGVKILGSMCILSHMDSTLCSCRWTIVWTNKEKEEVWMGRWAYLRGSKAKETITGSSSTAQSRLHRYMWKWIRAQPELDRW